MVVFETGRLVGADTTGGEWDGTYEHNPKKDTIDVQVKIKLPPNVINVATGKVSDGNLVEEFKLSLPNIDLGEQTEQKVIVFGNMPMQLLIKKIRDLDTF